MRVSWLIPVRDRQAWLRDAVHSALRDSTVDDELLVIDDGSEKSLEGVLPVDSRVRLIRQEANGLVAALELGRRHARGCYLARLDSDDLSLPGRLRAQVERMDEEPGLVALGGRAAFHPDQVCPPLGMRHYLAWINTLSDPMVELLVESPLIHPSVLLRADAVDNVGGYRDAGLPEDYDLWLRLVQNGGRIANLQRPLVWIRDHRDRLTRTHPRYSRDAFRRAKMEWVRSSLLLERPRVVVWGAGRTGRPWIRWLVEQGVEVTAVLDLKWGGRRQGIEVLPTTAVADLRLDLLLVAVGARGARSEIRGILQRVRPDLIEGIHWWAVA